LLLLKNEIENFLALNSEEKSIIQRFFKEIPQINLSALFEKFSTSNNPVFFFSKPTENFTLLAVDQVISDSFEKVYSHLKLDKQKLVSNIVYNATPPEKLNIPLFIGSKKFTEDKKETIWNDFEYENWFIPKTILIKNNDSYYIVINFIMGESDLSFLDYFERILSQNLFNTIQKTQATSEHKKGNDAEWISQVKKYLEEIHIGKIEKAVLARREVITIQNFSYSTALQYLQDKYPDCFTFAFKKINSVFWGATPEKLFTTDNSSLQTEAIAGSAPRGKDRNEDHQLENKLLNTPKELHEHNNVVKFIQDKISPFVTDLSIREKLGIKKLKNIQHIRTSFSANVKGGIDILDIVNSLHPTPAVCGFPRKEAFDLIERTENFDRGLYSGIIGWFDEKDNSEFVVGIRSALVKNSILYAYAGCGIVEGSDPISEYNETELKLKPILSVLINEITC
jgi:menaquinone-specific isochorismate synthase